MMNQSLIISDLHLSHTRPDTVALFMRFLEERAQSQAQLFILGDLFDAWIGDDNQMPPIQAIKQGLRRLSDSGCEVLVMHGNRDFLIGEGFAGDTGCKLIPDPYAVELAGSKTLLMHGDLLCTDDVEYQQARRTLRDPAFIQDFVSRPMEERVRLAAEYRQRSGEVVSLKPADIMDVNQETVESYMTRHQVKRLIHGHTHRPALHQFALEGKPAERYVLEDWQGSRGNYLCVTQNGISQETFE